VTSPSPLAGEGGTRSPPRGGGGGGYSDFTLERAQQLRHDLTPHERILWRHIRNSQLGAKFRRQQPIGPFIADFVSQDHRLIIELDGSQHCESQSDIRRDAFLVGRGYRVLRFWNSDLTSNLNGVIETIIAAIETPSPSQACGLGPSLSLEGRGENGVHHG
jgi:very-short-patch-repair endonuclease